MKQLLISAFILFTPISAYATSTPELNKLGEAMKLDCRTIGNNSCISRFASMSACSFAYGVAYGKKSVKESLSIADDLFVLLMKGNRVKVNDMFGENNLIKKEIRAEIIQRVNYCKEWVEASIPIIHQEVTGQPASQEFIKGATESYGEWWCRSLEDAKLRQVQKSSELS